MPKKNTARKKTKSTQLSKPQRVAHPKSSPSRETLAKGLSSRRIWNQPSTWRNLAPTPSYRPLPKARSILKSSVHLLWVQKKLFGSLLLVYGTLNLLLVRGLAPGLDVANIKAVLSGNEATVGGQIRGSMETFFYILGSAGGSKSDVAGLYQSLLLVLVSLAIIWAIRQVLAGHKVTAKESFYHGMSPLVPYLLTYLLLGAQLLPLIVAGYLYATVLGGGIALHVVEQLFWAVVCITLALWSLKMATSTIFATYIVTLPDMTPLRAYRSGNKLVVGRRLLIWRKLLFLPVIYLLATAVIMVPIIMFSTSLAPWVLFILSIVALPVAHAYLYKLYRELL